MAQLMLVNPRRRKRRKMSAKQAKYFGPRRKRRARRAASANPRRRRRAASAPVRRRRRRTVLASYFAGSRNPRRRRRTARRNPIRRSGGLSLRSLTSGSVLKSTVMPAALGALGAVALDVAYAYLPIPANLKAGTFAVPVKAAAILGVGILANRFLPRQRTMINNAVGASLTIMAYNYIRAQMGAMLPNVHLGVYTDNLGYTGAAQFLPDYSTPDSGVGQYISGANPGSAASAWDQSQYGDTVF